MKVFSDISYLKRIIISFTEKREFQSDTISNIFKFEFFFRTQFTQLNSFVLTNKKNIIFDD